MYAIRVDMDPRLRSSPLREYARLEYGNEDVEWFLAAARRSSRKVARRPLASRLRFRRAPHAHRPVGCKGTPRLSPSDLASPS